MSETTQSSNTQLARELAGVRQDLAEMKNELSVHKEAVRHPPRRSFGSGLFNRNRRQPVVEPVQSPSKLTINMEELLPLLPYLSEMFPQLKGHKVAEAIKMLSNPAVISLIQQFLQNNMGLKQSPTVVQQRGRSLLR